MEERQNLSTLVHERFGLELASVGEVTSFDASQVRVMNDVGHAAIEDHGKFKLQRFKNGSNGLYKLVIYDGDFPANHDLVEFMKDEELLDVRDYEAVRPIKDIHGYFLYRLVPYTVQGQPTWGDGW